jgi:alpha/beta superfamily hydrolase
MRPIRFPTEDGHSLEGELRPAEGEARGSAVLCHAHPRFGGSKDHPILWAVRNELAGRGFTVLSFNFRGTMRSAGTHGGGRSEVKDVAAAIGCVRQRSVAPTIVAGWSFGANVALREALDDDRVAALALIGFPLHHEVELPAMPSASELRRLRKPVLLLSGEHDAYSPPAALAELGAQLPNGEVSVVPGTDHYLWRHEREAAGIVGSFADRVLARRRSSRRRPAGPGDPSG